MIILERLIARLLKIMACYNAVHQCAHNGASASAKSIKFSKNNSKVDKEIAFKMQQVFVLFSKLQIFI